MTVEIVLFKKPVLTISLVAGGDLAVGVEIFIQAYFQKYGGRAGAICSPISDEVSIIPTLGNQTIKLEWKYSDGLGGFINGIPPEAAGLAFKWDTKTMLSGGLPITWGDDVTFGHKRFSNRYFEDSFFTGNSTELLSANLPDSTSHCTRFRFLGPDFCWNDDGLGNDGLTSGQPVKLGFSQDKGKIGIKITGSGNTRNDIFNALLAESDADGLYMISGYWNDASSPAKLDLLGVIYGDGTGEINLLGCETLAGNVITPNLNWDNSSIQQYYFQSIGNLEIIPDFCDFIMRSIPLRYLLGGSNNTIKSFDGTAFGYIDGWILPNIRIDNFMIVSDAYVRNTKFINSFMRFYFYATGQTTDLYFENLSFFNNGIIDYDLDLRTSFTLTSDRIIYIDNCSSDRSNGQIISLFENDDGVKDIKLHIREDINFKITDSAGNNLENVFISITDNNGVVYSGLSNASGELTLTVLWYKSIFDILNANGLYSKNEDQGPFVLRMTKAGKMDYQETFAAPDDILKQMAMIDNIYYSDTFDLEVEDPDEVSIDVTKIKEISLEVTL